MTHRLMVFVVFVGLLVWLEPSRSRSQNQDAKESSASLFQEAAKVFQHPRCLNCHPAGDQPTQTMEMRTHAMVVTRGPDDHGAVAMKCSACHGEMNNRFSKVPGAPHWGLAPKKMAWVGLSQKQLCELLKDPNRNGGRNLQQLVEHNAKDPLVGWAWNPGENREPVPGTQEQFGKLIARWVATGAECPAN